MSNKTEMHITFNHGNARDVQIMEWLNTVRDAGYTKAGLMKTLLYRAMNADGTTPSEKENEYV